MYKISISEQFKNLIINKNIDNFTFKKDESNIYTFILTNNTESNEFLTDEKISNINPVNNPENMDYISIYGNLKHNLYECKLLNNHSNKYICKPLKKIRNLIYGGCFCPPHKSHYLNVINRVNMFENIYIFFYLENGYRHGSHVNNNYNIFKLYLGLEPGNDNERKCSITINNCTINLIKCTDYSAPYLFGISFLFLNKEETNLSETVILIGDDYDYDIYEELLYYKPKHIFIANRDTISATNLVSEINKIKISLNKKELTKQNLTPDIEKILKEYLHNDLDIIIKVYNILNNIKLH